MAFKAAVLVGGPQKGGKSDALKRWVKREIGEFRNPTFGMVMKSVPGTRFRPLSLQLPKPLFPIAGVPLVEHHIDQLSQLPGLSEILLIGFYDASEFTDFIFRCQQTYRISIKYLQEVHPLGTAGGLIYFNETLMAGNPEAIYVINADVCGDLPVKEMGERLKSTPEANGFILTTEATREQSLNFGSVVIGDDEQVLHFVNKPTTFVSTNISCGVYLFRTSVLKNIQKDPNGAWLETDVLPMMVARGDLYAYNTTRWWSQTKTAAAVIYANRHYLRLYRFRYAARLATRERAVIIGDVFIDPSAEVHPTATIGPNVSIGPATKIGKGVRIKESIVLAEAVIQDHACVLHSVIGWRSDVGRWARVEGIPLGPNPNVPFAKLENKPLFLSDGRLNPSLTILGSDVIIADEKVVLNCVVLPYKELTCSYKNQIIL